MVRGKVTRITKSQYEKLTPYQKVVRVERFVDMMLKIKLGKLTDHALKINKTNLINNILHEDRIMMNEEELELLESIINDK
jgi:hypothetical protein